MTFGNKLSKIRKENKLTQEALSERINVTRQTISNWEQDITSPSANELKELSKALSVSIDELLDNNLDNIILKNVETTKKETKLIKRILTILFIIIVISIILFILLMIRSNNHVKAYTIVGESIIKCILDKEEHSLQIEYNYNMEPIITGGDNFFMSHLDLEKYNDVYKIEAHIDDYFKDHNGKCEIDNHPVKKHYAFD